MAFSVKSNGFIPVGFSCINVLRADNNELTTEKRTRRTCVNLDGAVVSGRKGHGVQTNCFQHGGDLGAAAVRLAVNPITHAPVVAFVVPIRARG